MDNYRKLSDQGLKEIRTAVHSEGHRPDEYQSCFTWIARGMIMIGLGVFCGYAWFAVFGF